MDAKIQVAIIIFTSAVMYTFFKNQMKIWSARNQLEMKNNLLKIVDLEQKVTKSRYEINIEKAVQKQKIKHDVYFDKIPKFQPSEFVFKDSKISFQIPNFDNLDLPIIGLDLECSSHSYEGTVCLI